MLEHVAVLLLSAVTQQAPSLCPPTFCPACPECPAAPPERPPKHWAGAVGLGVVSLTGNARSLTVSLNAGAEYKVTDWILAGRATATYGESRVPATGATETSAEDASLFLRVDRRFTPRFASYALAGVEADHPKSLEARLSQELGVSYAWIDRAEGVKKLLVRNDLGFRVSEEYRFEYFPVRGSVPGDYPNVLYAPRIGAVLRYEIDKTALFTEDLEVLPGVSDPRSFVNSTTKLTTRLYEWLGFGVAFTVNYDSRPPSPKIPWDTRLTVQLEYLL